MVTEQQGFVGGGQVPYGLSFKNIYLSPVFFSSSSVSFSSSSLFWFTPGWLQEGEFLRLVSAVVVEKNGLH